jgi:hypothetical protein
MMPTSITLSIAEYGHKKAPQPAKLGVLFALNMPGRGFEPRTRGFSIHCSTN